MTMPGEDSLRGALAGAVAELDESRRLAVVEVAAEGIVVFDLHRDDLGRPRGRRHPVVSWASLEGEHGWDHTRQGAAEEAVVRAAGIHSYAESILVCSSPGSTPAGQALAWLREARPEALVVVQADARIGMLLQEVVLGDSLDRPYELVVLKRSAATGRLELAAHQLFAIGSRPGAVARVSVCCEAADERGTAFAVVAWGRRPLLLSLQAARLVPGRYDFTVKLERPGRIRLIDLPGLTKDDRTWADLVAAVPHRLDGRAASRHLICAVEVSGDGERVGDRLDRVRQMVTATSAGRSGPFEVSLVTYSAHSYRRGVPEEPVEIVDWLASPESVLASLSRLEERGPAAEGHPYGAQLEDMLAVVAERVTGRDAGGAAGRTVLLTVGDRPPHPARVNGTLLPCPERRDWDQLLRRLEQHPGMAFGAIRDRPGGETDPVWSRLGAVALAQLDAVDIREFGADLGLAAPPSPTLPFPLIEVP